MPKVSLNSIALNAWAALAQLIVNTSRNARTSATDAAASSAQASSSAASGPSSPTNGLDDVEFRHPQVNDGHLVWQLVNDCAVLETNTCYAYLLLCRDFSATSIVAYRDGHLLGFVAGYSPPDRPDHLFIWQVGVSSKARRMGLAKRMLLHLWDSPSCASLSVMEATVGVSNEPSRRLFESVATAKQAAFERTTGFESTDFGPTPQDQHEPEETILIRLPRR